MPASGPNPPRIRVEPDGPYVVEGTLGLAPKQIVTSERDESLVWRTGAVQQLDDGTQLCRCGGSSDKPFCDGSHASNGFDGSESAPADDYDARATQYPGTGMVLHDDRSICAHASFCATKQTNAWKMMRRTDDTAVRSQAMAMVERCPSGALTYEVRDERIEPDVPTRINAVRDGPLLLTGGVEVERADGQPLETRNRVTLCRCGASSIKPLCDGSHVDVGFEG